MDRYFEDVGTGLSGLTLDESDPSKFFASLSAPVRQRVASLKAIQVEQDKIRAEIEETIRKLEKKFLRESYQPLFDKRFAVVNGLIDPSGGTNDGPQGVPDFWLEALKKHPDVSMTITDRDKDALKHLVDVRLEYLDGEPGSFQLSFHFAPNPFFTNAVLRKRFFYKSDAVTGIIKPSHTEAPDKIDWKKGMDLSVIIEKKKKKGKGSQKSRVVQETVPADTFFEFFNQPQSTSSKKGGGDDDDDTDDWLQLEMDFETGEKFKNQIIPHAVNWYTGEAAEDEWEDNSYDDEEQEEQEEEDSDDQEDSADNAETDEDSE